MDSQTSDANAKLSLEDERHPNAKTALARLKLIDRQKYVSAWIFVIVMWVIVALFCAEAASGEPQALISATLFIGTWLGSVLLLWLLLLAIKFHDAFETIGNSQTHSSDSKLK